MKRTPDEVSRARQKAGQEIKVWRAGIQDSRLSPQLTPAEVEDRIAFCKIQIALCQKKIAETISKGKKEFWSHDRPQ